MISADFNFKNEHIIVTSSDIMNKEMFSFYTMLFNLFLFYSFSRITVEFSTTNND